VHIANKWKFGVLALAFVTGTILLAIRPVTAELEPMNGGFDEFVYLPLTSAQGLPLNCHFLEENRYVIMEVETAPNSDSPLWDFRTEIPGYTGRGYYHWIGPDLFDQPGIDILRYPIRLTNGGDYRLRIRNYHDHPANDQQNDVFVRLDNSPWVKLFSSVSYQWTWASAFDPHGSPPEEAVYFNVPAGDHVFEISARSFGFRIDRIALFQQGTDALNITLPESPCVYP
jgi:hypothetical protein